jgi:transcriptional repressor NrdR
MAPGSKRRYSDPVKCPFCAAVDDRVVDSRESREGQVIRRRRECTGCGRRFTSYETIEEIPYMVVKNDGRRERFDRNKLRTGLAKACEKRPVPPVELDRIVDEVESLLHDSEEREIATSRVGAIVMERIRELDKVAYVRFASVYRKFEDVDEFLNELKTLIGRGEKATS